MQPAGHARPTRCRTSGGRRSEDGEGRFCSLSISLHPPPRPEGVCSPRPYFFAPTGARQCHAYARWCRCDVYLYTAGLSNIKAATRTNEFLIALLMLAHRVVNHSRSRSFANEISCWKGWELPLSWRFRIRVKKMSRARFQSAPAQSGRSFKSRHVDCPVTDLLVVYTQIYFLTRDFRKLFSTNPLLVTKTL